MIDLNEIFREDLHTDVAGHYNDLFSRLILNHGEKFNEALDRKNTKLLIYDDEDAITKFKQHLRSKYSNDIKTLFNFYLICYYLHKQGYYIEQAPNFLTNPYTITEFNTHVVHYLAKKKCGNINVGSKMPEAIRVTTEELKFLKPLENNMVVSRTLEELFKTISTRNASFNEQEVDEKLETIRNAFENIGKINGNYVSIPWESISCNNLTKDIVQNFANELQCFRHGEKTLLAKRQQYTDEQKLFMIDYGLMILALAERHLSS